MQAKWTIKSLLEWTLGYFNQHKLPQARLEAEVLLARVLNVDRVYLYAHYFRPVDSQERQIFKEFIKRRISGEPCAYITGTREFMSLSFNVTRAVLIPRPETELLVETALETVRQLEEPRICDVGTGSGVVALSLLHYCPRARVMAGDISEEALQVARKNAHLFSLEVDFRSGSLLEPFSQENQFDLIVANLPYITDEEYQDLPYGVRQFEPRSALLASGDGLDLYRLLIPQAISLLKPGGHLMFEIGAGQGRAAREMVCEFAEASIIKDLSSRDRIIKARKGGVTD